MTKLWVALPLAVLLFASTLSGCTALRTPYEKQKIAENGGQVKKKQEEKGSDQSSGGEDKQHSAGKGGSSAKVSSRKQKPSDSPDVSPTRRVKDPLTMFQEKNQEKNPHLLYSATLSTQVSQVEGVGGGVVLLDEEHNAFVAIDTNNSPKNDRTAPKSSNEKLRVRTEGDISIQQQASIAKKLRQTDPLIDTVFITDNPSHAERFTRYANQIVQGGAGTLNTQALAEHIQDIWK